MQRWDLQSIYDRKTHFVGDHGVIREKTWPQSMVCTILLARKLRLVLFSMPSRYRVRNLLINSLVHGRGEQGSKNGNLKSIRLTRAKWWESQEPGIEAEVEINPLSRAENARSVKPDWLPLQRIELGQPLKSPVWSLSTTFHFNSKMQCSSPLPGLALDSHLSGDAKDPIYPAQADRGSSQHQKKYNNSPHNSNISPVNSISSSSLSNQPYSASLKLFKTVKNDSTLFQAAMAIGLVQILVENLDEDLEWELEKRNMGKNSRHFLWWRGGSSGTDVWCDTCLKLLGAKISYGKPGRLHHRSKGKGFSLSDIDCHVCPELVERCWFISHCSDCYDNRRTLCQAQGHSLEPDDSSISATCRTAVNPHSPRSCDAVDCGKKISGLYFRKLL